MKAKLSKYYKNTDRRIEIKIENHDTWSLDHTLALIILPALIQLKATKQGVPAEFADSGGDGTSKQLCFDFYSETSNDAFDENVKKWDEILDKMIWAFEQIATDEYDSLYHHGRADYDFEKTGQTFFNPITGKQETTYKLVDKNPNEHWYDYVGHRLHEERIQEGLNLFGKYYRNLWD